MCRIFALPWICLNCQSIPALLVSLCGMCSRSATGVWQPNQQGEFSVKRTSDGNALGNVPRILDVYSLERPPIYPPGPQRPKNLRQIIAITNETIAAIAAPGTFNAPQHGRWRRVFSPPVARGPAQRSGSHPCRAAPGAVCHDDQSKRPNRCPERFTTSPQNRRRYAYLITSWGNRGVKSSP